MNLNNDSLGCLLEACASDCWRVDGYIHKRVRNHAATHTGQHAQIAHITGPCIPSAWAKHPTAYLDLPLFPSVHRGDTRSGDENDFFGSWSSCKGCTMSSPRWHVLRWSTEETQQFHSTPLCHACANRPLEARRTKPAPSFSHLSLVAQRAPSTPPRALRLAHKAARPPSALLL